MCSTSAPSKLEDRFSQAADVLLAGAPSVGVAVSGGSDSLALLLLLHARARERRIRLEAATVDHGVRPEAAEEARQVAAICRDIGVRHDTLRLEFEGAATQARLRTVRHKSLARWARGRGLGVLALGHTEDDRIETFLLRLRAGSDWWGLAGPMPSSPSPVWPEGDGVRLVRPLGSIARADLRTWLSRRERVWADDPSNDALRYERTRVRAIARALSPEGRRSVLRTQQRFMSMRAAVLGEARRLAEDPTIWNGLHASLSRREYASASHSVRLRTLEALIAGVGGRDSPPKAGALLRLEGEISGPSAGCRTLSGAMVRWNGRELRLRPEPLRRSARTGGALARPDAEAARRRSLLLLADPRLAALAAPPLAEERQPVPGVEPLQRSGDPAEVLSGLARRA